MKQPRLLLDFIRKRWYLYAAGIGCLTAANVLYANFPRLLGRFTDRLNEGTLHTGAIAHYGLLLAGIGGGFALLGGLGQFQIVYAGRLFERETRRRLFAHFAVMSESFYANRGVGRLLNYFMNDVTGVRESISNGVNQTTNATILTISVIATMALSDIPPYLIAVCVLPLVAIPFAVVRFGPRIRQRSLEVQNALGSMTEMAEEQLGGIRVTKTFAAEPIMNRRFAASVDGIRDRQLRLVRVSSLFQAIIPFTGALAMIVAIAFGGYLATEGRITLGLFVALTLYIRMMITPLQQIGNVINTMQRSRASLERLNKLFAEQPDIADREGAEALEFEGAAIEIAGLTFVYPGAAEPALADIELTLQPGRTLGIVGRIGSGKTTLAKLLLRMYDPTAGAIRVGGRDLRDATLRSLREGLAYVPQDGFLFRQTIRDNIAFHNRDAGMEEVELAARQARFEEDVLAFPSGFETPLGERGITLSGGQRQRLSLARGLMKRAPALILDDSFSAVDAVTEKRIADAIREERRGRTNVVISHRISAVRFADEIVVLERGRIAERGTHRELLARGGLYAQMHALQEEGAAHG